MLRVYISILFSCLWLAGSARADLIADVRTTAGNFSINLNYIGARRTVSNFYRLAEGLQPWLDEKKGKIQSGVPFYNGLKFYKKEGSGLSFPRYIQAGARYPSVPNPEQQGAGYVVRDEIRRSPGGTMVVPHGLYTVSMANTGPHSSSSQFFINLIADSSWDDSNSAFGEVMPQFIEYPPVGAPYVSHTRAATMNAIFNSVQPVTIQSITFRLTGASEFNSSERATELPWMVCRGINSITHTPSDVLLGYETLTSGAEMRVFYSTDLFSWDSFGPATKFAPAETNAPLTVGHGGFPRAFFQLTAAAYPVSTVPANLYGKKIRILLGKPNSSPAVSVVQLNFDQNGLTAGNAYYVPDSSGALVYGGTFTYSNLDPKGPYHADLVITPTGFASETFRLYFGGANVDVSENEYMAAEIINTGGIDPTEAQWFYVTP